MTRKIGFCCKWIDDPSQVNGIKPKDPARKYNTGTTTIRWLNEHKSQAEDRLWQLMKGNIESVYQLVKKVSTLDESLRMVRISSDILPAYTEPTWSYFWLKSDVRDYAARYFAKIGDLARLHDVRLSFHPGQFCVLASDNDEVVARSIEEFEYHVDMARMMGYGGTWHDHGFKINVHISGRAGPAGIVSGLARLSTEARNLITIENEEISYGLDDCLSIADKVPIVLDVHHHWVREGEYISPNDDRVKRVVDSWRGVRPVCHYSVSREDLLVGHPADDLPDHGKLLAQGHKRQKLRAHSDFMWNSAVNDWALDFGEQFDIQVEAKGKNLASFALYEQAKNKK
jgi:UV DNA damage endonuclease